MLKKMKIRLYNEEINLRERYCQLNDCPASCVEDPYINLYIKFSGCNAQCPFCIDDCLKRRFDEEDLKDILETVKSQVKIRKISFTGGEPTLNMRQLENSFSIVKEYSPESFTVINTNGYDLQGIFDSEILKNVDSVSLSRHHYLDAVNSELFGVRTKIANENDILQVSANRERASKIHFSCNLIKGYVDSPNEVEHYLDHANSLGVHDVGFVSLMPLNDYCKVNHVPFFDDVPNLTKMKEWKYSGCCECSNYLYLPAMFDGEAVKVYHRNPKKPTDFESMLMYDGAILRLGFSGKILTCSKDWAINIHKGI